MTKPRLAHKIIIPQPYIPKIETDIRKTFTKERKRLAEEKRRNQAEADKKTIQIPRKIA